MNKIIYLYIKESPHGLKYLGQTIKDPYKYMGSGKIWKRHLKKHKLHSKDIKTTILFTSFNREDIKVKGLYYSNLWDIVNSPMWANLMPESGDHSTIGYKPTIETRQRVREANSLKIVNTKTGEVYNGYPEAANALNSYKTTIRKYLFWNEKHYPIEYQNSKLEQAAKERALIKKLNNGYRKAKVKKKSSNFTGVHWSTQKQKWIAQIRINGKKICLGGFNIEEEAGKAYLKALEKIKLDIIQNNKI